MARLPNVQLLSALPKTNIILLYLSELQTCLDMLLISVVRETRDMLCASAADFILFSCDQELTHKGRVNKSSAGQDRLSSWTCRVK